MSSLTCLDSLVSHVIRPHTLRRRPFIRGKLLMQAGWNPVTPVQLTILQAQFQGTDYVVSHALPPGRF